jgi:hypothetical protein
VGVQMFYSDYRPRPIRAKQYTTFAFARAFVIYNEFGYVETLDYETVNARNIPWC